MKQIIAALLLIDIFATFQLMNRLNDCEERKDLLDRIDFLEHELSLK